MKDMLHIRQHLPSRSRPRLHGGHPTWITLQETGQMFVIVDTAVSQCLRIQRVWDQGRHHLSLAADNKTQKNAKSVRSRWAAAQV
jgi:hypothetical protein